VLLSALTYALSPTPFITYHPIHITHHTPHRYDHRTEELGGLTHFETENVAKIPEFERTLVEQRQTLINFIQNKIVFKMGNDPEYLAAKANFTSQNQEVIDGIAQQKHDEKALKKFIQNSADAGGTSA